MSVSSNSNINLNAVVQNLEKAERRALEHAGEVVADRLRANTPDISDAKGKHAKNSVVVSKVDQNNEVKVGYVKDVAWRIHFVEIGTIRQKPKAFIQRTEREVKQQVLTIIQDEVRRGLGL